MALSALSSAVRGGNVLDQIANPAIPDIVGSISRGQQAAAQYYDLRDKQATEAWGNALQQATDAQGNVDYGKAQALAARDPMARQGMLRSLMDTSQLTSSQLNRNIVTRNAMINAITPLLRPGLTDDQVTQGIHDGVEGLVSSGVFTRDQANKALMGLSPDPKTRLRQLESLRISLQPPGEQQTSIYGNLGTQTGPEGQTIGTRQSVQTGAVSAPQQPGAPLGMTPEQLNSPVWVRDTDPKLPNGEDNPNFGRFKQSTIGEQLRLRFPGQPVGGVPQPNLGSGKYPAPGQRNPNAPPAPAAPNAAPAPNAPPAPPEKPATKLSEAEEEQIKQSGLKFQQAVDAGNAENQTLATLGGMQSDINRFATGSGAERTLDWKRWTQSWAPGVAKFFGITPGEIASQEAFEKAVNQVVTQQAAHSDKEMGVVMGATPHATLSPEGVDSIIRQLQGNSDYIKARAKLADAFPNNTNWKGFQAKVADLDPRYFQYNRLTPTQKTEYFNGIPEDQREAFKTAYAKSKALVGG